MWTLTVEQIGYHIKKIEQHITSRTLCHPSSPLRPSPLLRQKMPLPMRRGQKRSSWGCSATLGPRETRCPRHPRRPPPHLPRQGIRRWSSTSRTCCSWPVFSTRACGGHRPRRTGLAKEPAASVAPPLLERGLCSCWAKQARWSGLNVSRRERSPSCGAGQSSLGC